MLLNPPNRQPGAINRNGLRNARRGVPADPFADLYGTGLGQIPMLLDPLDAVMSGANVVSIPNKGGAGAAFNATVMGTGAGMTREGGLLVKTSTTNYLQLSSPADLVGARLFVVSAVAPEAIGTGPRIAGRDFQSAAGDRTDMNVSIPNSAIAVRRHDGAGMPGVLSGTFPADPGGVLRLYEMEMAAGLFRVWVNGTQVAPVAYNVPTFIVDRVLGGLTTPYFTGLAGIAGSVITDGTPAMDPVMLRVRQTIAARYGITLP